MHHYTYKGSPKASYIATDLAELVELRARQRTLEGAYMRSTLLLLGSAVLIIKLFDARFYNIGIMFGVLAVLISVLAWFRRRHLNRDFSDQKRPATDSPTHGRLWGAPFSTAGWIVIGVSLLVTASEIVLVVLLFQI
ncbi:hypothetical protein M408DRAFT_27804 [Serendipita vermifera MAFF 305830]|uniref:DUF202 domain-containing protein n=1 Tax=Serendipita vermifera MAFF 305830 TaxID=933852 RepID=A0A0C2WB24_SERVB|nr:hypothetical protein M408DRAFT_27804 [Serendipita vermifera MAFF 305830]